MKRSTSRRPRALVGRARIPAGPLGAPLAAFGALALWAACGNSPASGIAPAAPVDCGDKLTNCDGLCVDSASDAANCGACGKACKSGEVCLKGKCDVTCGSLTKCGSSCADVNDDPAHCGACDKPCMAPPNTAPFCAAMQCGAACLKGYDDCNGSIAKDGCESNLATDPLNCSKCGAKCAKPAHAAPNCLDGKCGLGACDMGFDDCDKDPSTGCETDLAVSKANCGKCGMGCGMLQVCAGGTCIDSVPSCKTLHAMNPAAKDGVYLIDPDGPAGPIQSFMSFCDMTVGGGGWTQCLSFTNTANEDISCSDPGTGGQKWFHPCVDAINTWPGTGLEVMIQLRDSNNSVIYSGYGPRKNPWTYSNLTSPGSINSQYDRTNSQHPNFVQLNNGHRLTISGFDSGNAGCGGSMGNGYVISVDAMACYTECAGVLMAMSFKHSSPNFQPCTPRNFAGMSPAHELMYAPAANIMTCGPGFQPNQAFVGEMKFFVR